MRILVFSDVHSNLSALEAVLGAAGRYDSVWCLGDLVGYGPDPNECIARVRKLPNLLCVRGNHDAAVLGEMDQQTFNHEASLAITWTKHVINAESLDFLLNLPETVVEGDVTLVHGSPRNPVWEYLMDYPTALQVFPYFDSRLCFVGHTHVPALWEQNPGEGMPPLVHDYLRMTISGRSILNPGSVGQPRDHDKRAAFALFDTVQSTWELRRVEYDIASVQNRIKKTSLPWRHALRLNEGW
jgi:diadenosine tetraphosphatase ApaH/serine/threonine PP2A family protein phosphatase